MKPTACTAGAMTASANSSTPASFSALETGARFIANVKDQRVRRALATNFSDLLRYQNMLCRYDTMALKSLDMFSMHGFPVGYMQVESNFARHRQRRRYPCRFGRLVEHHREVRKGQTLLQRPL